MPDLANPWTLALLLPAAALVLWSARPRRRPTLVYSSAALARQIGPGWRGRVAWLPVALRLACLALLLYAAARPQRVIGKVSQPTESRALQLVLDRSGSMGEPTDFEGRKTDRLDAAKKILRRFVEGDGRALRGREGDLVGLIVFGTFADTLCPLVRDHKLLTERINAITIPEIRGEQGTAIGDALMLAAARLKKYEEELARAGDDAGFTLAGKAVILLTDGENTEGRFLPEEAAEVAANWGVRVYVIGIRGGATQIIGNRRVFIGRDVNEPQLTRVAETTGGRFWAVDSLNQLPEVYAAIDALEPSPVAQESTEIRAELFTLPAALGLGLLMLERLLATTILRRTP
jgi:Ca-activated chloride channel family protein